MKRRDFLLAGTLAALGAPAARSQPRIARIGMLSTSDRSRSALILPVLKRLAELGYVEGRNLTIELRNNEGDPQRVTPQVRELLGLKPDLIMAMGPINPARALVAEKASVPVVLFAIDYDPVENGIVASYNRPGGNITGVYIPQPALAAKRLELARELLPAARRFLVVYDAFSRDQLAAVQAAAMNSGIGIEAVEFKAPPYDYAAAVRQGRRAGAQGWIGMMAPTFFVDRARIADLALKERLPVIGGANQFAEAGFLASYGAPFAKVAERGTDIAVRILRGTKPADIPVEQVNVFEFAVNMKIARVLGIAIPQSILVRADMVIE